MRREIDQKESNRSCKRIRKAKREIPGLPTEIWSSILLNLTEVRDVCNAELVCIHWKAILDSKFVDTTFWKAKAEAHIWTKGKYYRGSWKRFVQDTSIATRAVSHRLKLYLQKQESDENEWKDLPSNFFMISDFSVALFASITIESEEVKSGIFRTKVLYDQNNVESRYSLPPDYTMLFQKRLYEREMELSRGCLLFSLPQINEQREDSLFRRFDAKFKRLTEDREGPVHIIMEKPPKTWLDIGYIDLEEAQLQELPKWDAASAKIKVCVDSEDKDYGIVHIVPSVPHPFLKKLYTLSITCSQMLELLMG